MEIRGAFCAYGRRVRYVLDCGVGCLDSMSRLSRRDLRSLVLSVNDQKFVPDTCARAYIDNIIIAWS